LYIGATDGVLVVLDEQVETVDPAHEFLHPHASSVHDLLLLLLDLVRQDPGIGLGTFKRLLELSDRLLKALDVLVDLSVSSVLLDRVLQLWNGDLLELIDEFLLSVDLVLGPFDAHIDRRLLGKELLQLVLETGLLCTDSGEVLIYLVELLFLLLEFSLRHGSFLQATAHARSLGSGLAATSTAHRSAHFDDLSVEGDDSEALGTKGDARGLLHVLSDECVPDSIVERTQEARIS
jgi:hypothetical protein